MIDFKSKSFIQYPKYKGTSSWWEHVPVAEWLIERLQPEKVIELGTHYGVSFFSMCEAAQQFSKDTFVYAVDTWQGDSQAGYYGDEVYNIVSNFFNENYKQNGRLIRSTFDEAAQHFDNNEFDLIHIDGLHTYEAVKHDYEIWKPKLKNGGTILFHDWNVREGNFGVWKLWKEVKEDKRFQCMEIRNGHGLAIATLTDDRQSWHRELEEILPILKIKGYLLSELDRERQESIKAKNNVMEQEKRMELLEIELGRWQKHSIEQERIIELLRRSGLQKLKSKIKNIIKNIVQIKNMGKEKRS